MPISFTSKIILINTILVTMTSHITASLPISLSTSSIMDSLINSFLWDKKDQTRICWVKKGYTRLAKEMGDFGFVTSVF